MHSTTKPDAVADIERIAKAIEMDAGQSISTIRDALSEVRDGNVGATYTKEHDPLLRRRCSAPYLPPWQRSRELVREVPTLP